MTPVTWRLLVYFSSCVWQAALFWLVEELFVYLLVLLQNARWPQRLDQLRLRALPATFTVDQSPWHQNVFSVHKLLRDNRHSLGARFLALRHRWETVKLPTVVVYCVFTRLNFLLKHFNIEFVLYPSLFVGNRSSLWTLKKETTRILLGCHVWVQLALRHPGRPSELIRHFI